MTVSGTENKKSSILKIVVWGGFVLALFLIIGMANGESQYKARQASAQAEAQNYATQQQVRAAEEAKQAAEADRQLAEAYRQALLQQSTHSAPSQTHCTSYGYSMLNSVDTTCTSF